ncbi:hypothetical protein SAMN00120144_1720 [Hymenobacter roseosalivarius DSM 11622]|uniref:Uncharacterized protein n=1 Tax=Hymenobacter roseosalivarius DSM 11622 TaxID=645990 RepID=A0A1W1W4A9_9BACT|nr:DUF5606 domain-containing protein [Hymenobacter roseosalivarius]SMC00290.1 hypothetical protein SAMN00120144_1720 [Hymenobacter roseosalivarius DSM 11622]
MPYDLKEIAAISGMPGLYRLVRPTRNGVIVESLDEKAARSVASARNKVSLLQEISIYTQDYDQTVPLTEVFDRIYQQHGNSLPVNNKAEDRDLTAFMEGIIPDYDRQRVYMSDIKKLVSWYHAVSSRLDYQAPATEEESISAEEADKPAKNAPLTKSADKAGTQQEEPAADEALSTAGIIPAEGESDELTNPEAGDESKAAKKA